MAKKRSRKSRVRKWRGPRYQPQRKVCYFCREKTEVIDYKNLSLLRVYMSTSGKILSRRKTATCAKHQRVLAQAIKRARHLALLPYSQSISLKRALAYGGKGDS